MCLCIHAPTPIGEIDCAYYNTLRNSENKEEAFFPSHPLQNAWRRLLEISATTSRKDRG